MRILKSLLVLVVFAGGLYLINSKTNGGSEHLSNAPSNSDLGGVKGDDGVGGIEAKTDGGVHTDVVMIPDAKSDGLA